MKYIKRHLLCLTLFLYNDTYSFIPLFSSRPQTNPPGVAFYDTFFLYDQNDAFATTGISKGVWYGVKEDLTVIGFMPILLSHKLSCGGEIPQRCGARFTHLGKLDTSVKWRFFKRFDGQHSDQASFIGSVIWPTNTKRDLPFSPPSLDFAGILSYTHQTPNWFLYLNTGVRVNNEARGLRRASSFAYSFVVSYAGTPPTLDKWSGAIQLEVNGVQRGHDTAFGCAVPGSSGHTLWIGPSIGFGKEKFYANVGAQIAAVRGKNCFEAKPEFRAALNVIFVLP